GAARTAARGPAPRARWPGQPGLDPRLQRAVVPPRSPGPARRAAGHRAVLPPPRRDRRLEPALRVGRLRAVPTGAARPLRGRAPGRARTRRRTRTSLVPVGAQAARRRGPGPALLPAAGLDPGDGPAGRARPRAAA